MMERIVNLLFALLLSAATLFVMLRSPIAASDEPAPAPPVPATCSVRLLFAGDLMQHAPQVQAARTADGFDYGACFANVRDRFCRADLAVVNLETTLSANGCYTGYPCFRSPVALADALQEIGADVAVLANNHCVDGGIDGVRTTIETLHARGIRHTGLFADSTDYQLNNPLYLHRNGIRFALLNYTYSTTGCRYLDRHWSMSSTRCASPTIWPASRVIGWIALSPACIGAMSTRGIPIRRNAV